jgi:hypothetical protein
MKSSSIPSVPISFRLDQELVPLLDHYCQQTGQSRGSASRTLVVSHLTGGDSLALSVLLNELRDALAEQQLTLQQLRRDLAYTLLTTLVETAHLSLEEAGQKVRAALRQEQQRELT